MKPSVPEGLEVTFDHERVFSCTPNGRHFQDHDFRRGTVATLRDKNTCEIVACGYAVCNSKDQFSKRIGRDIALGRAIKSIS